MEWLTAITQLLASIAWPATLIIFLAVFRREIRQRLTSVTEVKYPGGSITMREVERLEARIEQSTKPVSESLLLPSGIDTSLPHPDSRLAIAQMRLDLEKELFRLSWRALNQKGVTSWPIGRHIDELERKEVLNRELADNLRSFIDVSNRVIHDSTLPGELVSRSSAIGGSLVAPLRHKRLVLEAERDFDGHGLWHMHRHLDELSRRYYFWSAVAASLPEFNYDYDVYREAAENHNAKIRDHSDRPDHLLYILSLEEFLSVLEFREQELLRLIDAWHDRSGDWNNFEQANKWQWPHEWGDLQWSGPILRDRVSLFEAEQDLMQTRAALDRHRPKTIRAAERTPPNSALNRTPTANSAVVAG